MQPVLAALLWFLSSHHVKTHSKLPTGVQIKANAITGVVVKVSDMTHFWVLSKRQGDALRQSGLDCGSESVTAVGPLGLLPALTGWLMEGFDYDSAENPLVFLL